MAHYCNNIVESIDASEFGPGSTGVVVVCGTHKKCADCKHNEQIAALKAGYAGSLNALRRLSSKTGDDTALEKYHEYLGDFASHVDSFSHWAEDLSWIEIEDLIEDALNTN